MVTEKSLKFLGKVFLVFEKWTKKMSKNENPKKLSPKILNFLYKCLYKNKKRFLINNYFENGVKLLIFKLLI